MMKNAKNFTTTIKKKERKNNGTAFTDLCKVSCWRRKEINCKVFWMELWRKNDKPCQMGNGTHLGRCKEKHSLSE